MARQGVGLPDDAGAGAELTLEAAGLEAAAFWGWSWYHNPAWPTTDHYVPIQVFALGWAMMQRIQAGALLRRVYAGRLSQPEAGDISSILERLERAARGEE